MTFVALALMIILSAVAFNVAAKAAGSAGTKPQTSANSKERPSVINKLIRVPLTRQATDYTCGAAALQSVFGYGHKARSGLQSRRYQSHEIMHG